MVFSPQTVLRLIAVLKGFLPAATGVFLLSGPLYGGAAIGGATLSCMGLALGMLVGISPGRWLGSRMRQEADRRLPLVLSLMFLPLAILPAQPEVVGIYRFGFHGWLPVLAGVAAAFPLGVATGCSWLLLGLEAVLEQRSRLYWGGAGVVLGVLVSVGAALSLSTFKGAFLVNLFSAPLVWPALPDRGERSLLVRMMLTLVVMVSTMFLLFL